jgi:tRNA(Ile)-lysidine synthase
MTDAAGRDDPLHERLRGSVRARRLWPRNARVMVAVSGGADSVALLHALRALRADWDLQLSVAHLDHGLREASARDARFVEELAAAWGLPAAIERRPVAQRCAQQGWSLEEGARRIRYQFLLEAARRHSASRVALAHTADDQAETVLMRLIRGTGLLGLGAIPAARALEVGLWVVRPLLETWRSEILDYTARHGLAYREDATNADPRFVRNRIRHELLPLLERRYNPNIKGALAHLAEQSRGDYAYLEEAAGRQWKRAAKVRQLQGIELSIPVLRRQPLALQRQLWRQAIQRLKGDARRLEFRHWLEMERLLTERPDGTRLDLPGGIQMVRERERLICRRAAPALAHTASEAVY